MWPEQPYSDQEAAAEGIGFAIPATSYRCLPQLRIRVPRHCGDRRLFSITPDLVLTGLPGDSGVMF